MPRLPDTAGTAATAGPTRLARAARAWVLVAGLGSCSPADTGGAQSGDAASPRVVEPHHPEGLDPEVSALLSRLVAAARKAPRSAEAHGELGFAYEASSLWPEARDAFANAEALDPERPVWPYHRAIATMQSGDLDGAVDVLEEVVLRFPEFAPAHHRLGDAMLDTARAAEARSSFETVVRLAPEAAEGHVGLGRAALADGDFAVAAEHLERAVELAGDYAQAHFLLGQAYRGLGHEREAERESELGRGAQKRFLPDPGTPRVARHAVGLVARLAQARAQLDAGRTEAAIATLENAAQASPDRPEILNNLALAYGSAGKLGRAIATLERSIELAPDDPSTRESLALAHLDAGDAAAALAEIDEALRLAPDSPRARLVRGGALLRLGRHEEAHGELTRALRERPGSTDALFPLAEACARLGRLVEAASHLERLLAARPRHVEGRVLACRVALSQGRSDDAARLLSELRDLAPEHPQLDDLERRLATSGGADRGDTGDAGGGA